MYSLPAGEAERDKAIREDARQLQRDTGHMRMRSHHSIVHHANTAWELGVRHTHTQCLAVPLLSFTTHTCIHAHAKNAHTRTHVCLSPSVFVRPQVPLSVSVSQSVSVCLSVCHFSLSPSVVYPYVPLCLSKSVSQSVCQSVCLSLSLSPSLSLSLPLSLSPSLSPWRRARSRRRTLGRAWRAAG